MPLLTDSTHKELTKVVWYTGVIISATVTIMAKIYSIESQIALMHQDVEYLKGGKLKISMGIPPQPQPPVNQLPYSKIDLYVDDRKTLKSLMLENDSEI